MNKRELNEFTTHQILSTDLLQLFTALYLFPKDPPLFFSQCLHVPVIYACLQTYWLMSHILTKQSMCRRVMEMLGLSNIHSAGWWVCIHSVSSDLCCSSGQKETCNTPSPSTAPLIGHARASAGLG